MDIDLTSLITGNVNEIKIDDNFLIPKEYYEETEIVELKETKMNGKIYIGPSEDDIEETQEYIKCHVEGTMIIEDSISLEPIEYPYSFDYDDILEENCKKNTNTLDIFQFLWENIVLEIPLQFTKVEDLSKFHGDGWKLISEDELKTSQNPFSDLLKNFKEE